MTPATVGMVTLAALWVALVVGLWKAIDRYY